MVLPEFLYAGLKKYVKIFSRGLILFYTGQKIGLQFFTGGENRTPGDLV
jgi:hypothetical protein